MLLPKPAGSEDRTVRVWNLHSSECKAILHGNGSMLHQKQRLPILSMPPILLQALKGKCMISWPFLYEAAHFAHINVEALPDSNAEALPDLNAENTL